MNYLPYVPLMSIQPPLRFLLLAGLGLGSLYMMHLLAQDFNKIRQPVAKFARLLISKRDLSAAHKDKNEIENFEINWPKILKFDPFKCALALICQISAGAESENPEAANILELIQYSISKGVPAEVDKAYKLGSTTDLFTKCYREYPFCPYSAKLMLKLLDIHSMLFGSSTI